MRKYEEWICRYYASHADIPDGEQDGALVGKIIHCRDCAYWQDNNGGYPHKDCKWREDETPDADDWCSGAVRKEE